MAPKEKGEAQVFTYKTMACVLAVMEGKGATLGTKAYDLMSKLDGQRSASAFQHQFRAVKNRGKELVAALEDDAMPAKTPKSTKKKAIPTGKKRASTFDAVCSSCYLTDHGFAHRKGCRGRR
jgi:hypothetical protein